MLALGRFDYFHRGLHEAWAEVENLQDTLPQLHVEESIAITYDFPVYFMLNRNNKTLKERLLAGFDRIRLDGSYKALFLEYFGHLAERAQLDSRHIIRIDYPLPDNLPPVDTSLWLTP